MELIKAKRDFTGRNNLNLVGLSFTDGRILKLKEIYIYIYQDQTIEKFKHHKGYEFFSFTFVGLYIVLKDEC